MERGGEHLTPDDILDLVHDLSDREEKSAAYQHLKECESCAEEFRLQAATRLRREADFDQRTEQPKKTFRWLPLAVAAAAVVATAVWLLPGGSTPAGYQLPDFEFSATSTRVAEPAELEKFEEGLQLYLDANHAAATEILQEVRLSPRYNGMRVLYIASAYQQLDRLEEARELLEDSRVHTFPREWRDRGYWMLLELIGDDSTMDSQRMLSELAVPEGEFTDQALERLQE